MINEPQRWLDRLVSACVSLFVGALALYGAVWLLCQIWTALVAVTVVLAIATVTITVWRWRHSRW